ncbi:MAG TPA: J domain-containing protein [bacterium]|jgi:hypothetical protein|nr:J domain-containing protein [bacterium]
MGLFDLILLFIIGIVIFSVVTSNSEISPSVIEEKNIELCASLKTGPLKDGIIKNNPENRYTTDEEIFIELKISGLENNGGESVYRIMYLLTEREDKDTYYLYQNKKNTVPFKEGGGIYNEIIQLPKEYFKEGNYTIVLKIQDMKDKEIKEVRQNLTIYNRPKNYYSFIQNFESEELPPVFWIILIGIFIVMSITREQKEDYSKENYDRGTFRVNEFNDYMYTYKMRESQHKRAEEERRKQEEYRRKEEERKRAEEERRREEERRKQEEYRRKEEERKRAEEERRREEERRKQEEYRRKEEEYSRKKSQEYSDNIKNLLREFELDPYGKIGRKEIKEQYRYWVEILHPDKNQNKSEKTRKKAEEKLKRINQIYEKLNKHYNK